MINSYIMGAFVLEGECMDGNGTLSIQTLKKLDCANAKSKAKLLQKHFLRIIELLKREGERRERLCDG